jgi:uncharacterized protein DUF4157
MGWCQNTNTAAPIRVKKDGVWQFSIMKAAQPQREQPKSNVDGGDRKARPQAATVSSSLNRAHFPTLSAGTLTLNDIQPPTLRLSGNKSLPGEKTSHPAPSLFQQVRETYFAGDVAHATSLVQKSLGSGHPLPIVVGSEMSKHYGRDFSSVRVHTDEFSARATTALDANAFTIGNNIVFAPNMFRPDIPSGRLRLAHELAHVVQQTGTSTGQQDDLENQASVAAILGSPYSRYLSRVGATIQREPTYPRRATNDQMITEARRVLSLTRDQSSSDETVRMWSNVSSNFGAVTAGSIARRIWTHIFVRHFTEPETRGDVESSHPRYLYSHQYGWIDAQHFFGFIDFAEAQYRSTSNPSEAFDAATAQGLEIEENQQLIRDWVIAANQEASRNQTLRLMQVRPPNTPMFRVPAAAVSSAAMWAAHLRASNLPGAQGELYGQLNPRQRAKFFMDSAKSAFTFEDFVSNQLGTRFFFTHGISINAAPEADRVSLFMSALSSFFSSIRVENDQERLNQLAQYLPTIERFEAPKTTEAEERRRHPELFHL